MKTKIKQRIRQIQRGEVPAGYKKTKVGIVPNKWEETRLSQYLTINNDKNTDLKYGKDDVFSISGELGIVNQIELLGRSYAGASLAPYGVVYPNDIVYTKSPLKANPYGIIKTNKTGKVGLVSTLYAVFHCKSNVFPDFVQLYFESKQNLNNYLYPIVNIGAKHDMKISDENSLKGHVVFPSFSEQKKISEILTTQDKLIELNQRKIEELKKLKKYYLSKMFPPKGSNVPEIRFKGFTKPWEQRELGKQYVKVSEKNDLSFGTDKIISVANMYFKEDIKESSDDYMRTYNVMRIGDIAFEGNKSKNYAHGRFVENTIGDGIVSHVFDVFRPITKYDLFFWKYIINNESVMGKVMTRCTKASTMMTNLVPDDFLKEKIAVPSLKEQQQIGTFFCTLDRLITLYQQKCEELKKHKKALMQLLLTGIVRVKT